ncbi:MAG TPA: Gmad2 immunoglobulin-like domain-containing protein, partial [Actinotalea sp.]|nr:Gmad2 immunoglobulin-like domain-containing protein [Actinotalea sp.]
QPPVFFTGPAPTETPEPAEDPTETAGGAAVNGPNSILVPQDGAVVTGPDVTVSGEGTAFEATLLYQVTRAGTEDVVAEGYTMGGANGEVGPWEIELTLDPGEYDVSVWEPGMGEGDQPDEPVNLVRVTFTVE